MSQTENGAASTSDRTEAKGGQRSEEFDLQTVRNVLNHISAVADLLPALEQQEAYDELREKLLRRLDGCARRLERTDTTREKLTIMEEMKASEIYYDLQLVEHANQLPLLHVARTVFSLSEKRTADRAPAKAPRPMRRKNASSALTSLRRLERERDRQSPSLVKTPQPASAAAAASTTAEPANDGDCPPNQASSVKKYKRRSQYRIEKEKPEKAEKEKDRNTDEDPPTVAESITATAQASSAAENNGHHSPDAKTTRKRAAAVVAAVSVAEHINPRASSPRKRAVLNSRRSITPANADTKEDMADEDEPTYCLCERVSFGDMICCDNTRCPVEWFHFECVNIKIKPKGKKWFCPLCRGEKTTVMKSSLQPKR
ncbi:zinc finger protein [Aphelenchoides avenae]|nr:zinc finger protein [Aphelenchus avenae]